jgi:hypothetical protein
MDSLPTGSIQCWLIVAAVALSPTLVFFVAQVIVEVLRRKWRERQPRGLGREARERATTPMG